MRNLKCGAGYNSLERPAKDVETGKITKAYQLWSGMLQRCYDAKVQAKHPSYIGCEVSENFKNYTYFYDWCHNQLHFGKKGFELDKDLLGDGKFYSEDVCVFVPTPVNKLLVLRGTERGNLPLGVTAATKGGYIARLNTGSLRKYLGYFSTPEEASACYLEAKRAYITQLANEYKHVLDVRVYEQLLKIDLENLK